ncbi:MAG: hypothetical protein AAGU11_04970 [Syntrophobacteraceae bacterium]
MSPIPVLKENRISSFGRVLVYLSLGTVCFIALFNLAAGKVVQPKGFFIVVGGFALFATSKLRVITRKKLISFGTKQMDQSGANLYRVGYWLMVLGIFVTFLG